LLSQDNRDDYSSFQEVTIVKTWFALISIYKIVFHSKAADHSKCAFGYVRSYDLDFDHVTLILDHNRDTYILKICLHTKNEVSRSRLSQVTAGTGQTQTDRQT